MANITLKIDAQDAGAVKALLALGEAERELELKVRKGNLVQRERLSIEERQAAAAKKATDAEAAQAAALRQSAAASLAAQKSAALLSDMRTKAAKEQRIATGFESAAARAQFEADGRNHERTKKRIADLALAQEQQRGGMRRGIGAAVAFAGSLAGVGTAAAAAMAVIRSLTAAHEHQMDVAKRSDEGAKGLKEFIALQAEGDAGKQHVKDAVLKGAAAGVSAKDVGAMAQPIQSVVDSDGDGKLNAEEKAKFDEDFAAALALRQAGVAADDAQKVITSGRSKGIGGKESADKLTAAADISAAGPSDFARSASAMGQFADQDTALAVATALTQEEKNFEQIPTLVRGAAKVLGQANDESDFSKKYGLAGLSEADKIAKLREEGKRRGKGGTEEERIASFSRSFRNDGMDEEAARAMGILVRQGEGVASAREKIVGAESGLAEKKVGALLADPLAGSAMRSEQAAAGAEATALYGPEAEGSRDKAAYDKARAADLQRFGGGQAVNEDGTLKGVFSWDSYAGSMAAARNGMPVQRGFERQQAGGGDEKLAASLEALNKSLQENTAATVANSAGAKKQTPVGGSAGNAEEKY
jgi:hypothetical protein